MRKAIPTREIVICEKCDTNLTEHGYFISIEKRLTKADLELSGKKPTQKIAIACTWCNEVYPLRTSRLYKALI